MTMQPGRAVERSLHSLLACALLLSAPGGCGGDPFSGAARRADIQSAAGAGSGQPVELFYVRADSACEYGATTAEGWLSGAIRVENLAYAKQVTVVWTEIHSDVWNQTPAAFLASLGDGEEVWTFETPPVAFSARLSADFQLAILYVVDGQTYWDNNHGRDHRISVGPRPLFPTDLVLGRSALALGKCQRNGWTGNYHGEIVLRNLAYHKTVRVVYTNDDWQTAQEVPAAYARPHGEDSEIWTFDGVYGGGYGYVVPVELAICYQVEGIEIWDNNFRANYRF